jgi:hypothetical protein
MATKERYFNPYATNLDEMYTEPAPPVPEKSLDTLLAELLALKPLTQDAANLLGTLASLKAELVEHVADAKSVKLEHLETRNEELILNARKLEKVFKSAKQETFTALQEHARLEGVSATAAKRLEGLHDEFDKQTLLTKAEKQEWSEKFQKAKQRAYQTLLDESKQHEVYNSLVRVEAEAGKSYVEAVDAANDIAKQIARLSGAGSKGKQSGLRMTESNNF